MTARRNNNLPEPKHHFARWGAGAAIALWALGIQYLVQPLNSIGAILSPAIGYLVGHILDFIMSQASIAGFKRNLEKAVSQKQRSIERLIIQRQESATMGSNLAVLEMIDSQIVILQQDIVTLITQLSEAGSKGIEGR